MDEKLNSRRCLFTNADRIRAMTDEELAEWGLSEIGCPMIKSLDGTPCDDLPYDAFPSYDGCKKCWLDWLKQECVDG